MAKRALNFVIQHFGVCLLLTLVLVIAVDASWEVYRYGGEAYYLRIKRSAGTVALTKPVGMTITGHRYQGQATNAQGQVRSVAFKTFPDNPGPLRRGDLVKVTVNAHYGVTDYQVVRSSQVPVKAASYMN